MRKSRNNYGLIIASAAVAASLTGGPLAGIALADPGNGNAAAQQAHDKHDAKSAGQGHSQGQHKSQAAAKAKSQGASKPKSTSKPKPHSHPAKSHPANSHAASSHAASAPGHTKSKPKSTSAPKPKSHGAGTTKSDPLGNNGTVKIAGPRDAVGHPSNNPHPGCTFLIEWFGYDQGADVVSTVTFTPQAPTSDVTIGGTAPSKVFVGGDHAGGGTDLDGRQAYTLTFSGGAPHPKQGYHVKVTVATPHSHGNDTKTKVYWVAPCTETPGTTGGTTPGGTTPGGTTPGGTTTTPGTSNAGGGDTTGSNVQAGAGAQAQGNSSDTGVLGSVAQESTNSGGAADTTAVPTAVEAGENTGILGMAQSPFALLLVGAGVALTAGAVVLRRRRA